MDQTLEKIVIVESDPASRASLVDAMQTAGQGVAAFAAFREALDELHQSGGDVLLLGNAAGPEIHEALATIRGSATTERIRVILLVAAGAKERVAALDAGADDAISAPWDSGELLARVRSQLRVRRAEDHMRQHVRVAEEGQQLAHTAFEALAVTEKMAGDATSLDRRLKIGVASAFAVLALMAVIYFVFARSAQKETQRFNINIARLEGGLIHQQDLAAQARKLRQARAASGAAPDALPDASGELQKHAADLKARMAGANSDQLAALQKELDATNARVKRVETDGGAPEEIIRTGVRSVCLLHVTVAFRSVESGQRLRYAGLNSQGEPLQDSDGNPVMTLDGRGPEVTLDVFGTGFLAGAGGRLLTNRHVAEPWWKNDDLIKITSQGFRAEISTIRAYFPDDPRAFHVEIQRISPDTDLAVMQADLQDLKRPVLPIDSGKTAAVTGGPMVVMGYATGLAAILARTDEDTAQQILKSSGGDVSQILDQLAHRNLIRPVITQGHIGDILPDKIVFDAQTTSGGSGGPLFNDQGKVIGVTYAILEGFGGSNFGIPIRFSDPLLSSASLHSSN